MIRSMRQNRILKGVNEEKLVKSISINLVASDAEDNKSVRGAQKKLCSCACRPHVLADWPNLRALQRSCRGNLAMRSTEF